MSAPIEPSARVPKTASSAWLGHALASIVLVASLLLVLAYWRTAQQRGLDNAQADFQSSNRQVLRLLQQRMVNYELLARGGASLQASLPRPSQVQWQRYVAGLDMSQRLPAVEALGYALDVQPSQLGALEQALPGLSWGAPAQMPSPAGAAGAMHAIILYVAPENASNRPLAGQDLASVPARRLALQAASADRAPRISAPVPPLEGAKGAPASDFIVAAPVFAEAANAQAPPALRGWVFVDVRSEKFIEAAMQAFERGNRLRIVDTTGGREQVVHAEAQFLGAGAGRVDPEQRPAFVHSLPLAVPGRSWRVDFESPPLTEVRAAIPGLRMTVLAGVLGSLLIFGIALILARTRARAQALAAQMSDSYRRSEQRFRSAMRYSAIGKALLDKQGRILDTNPAMAQLLGTTEQALVGTLLGQHFVEGEGDTLRTVEREVLSDGSSRATRRLRRSDGSVRHASMIFATVPGDAGDEFASLVQVEDVTERLRAEARVQALNRTLEARVALRTRELSHANQEMEAFAYSVSHDLRAPLRSIDGFSRLLSERYGAVVDASGQDYLQRIRKATARMSELIDALLKMSRISRGQLEVADVDLSAMALEIASELRNTEPARQAEFRIAPELHAKGDPALLRNLMDNLLGNAWKFTRERSPARIEFGHAGDGEFFVRDNGAGFPSQYAAKLFRPFQRLHSEEQYAGHGIGLASVKRVLERHGGDIRAEGEEGKGATFHFRIPAPPED